MRLACVSPTDQGKRAGLFRWGTVPSCASGSINKIRKKIRPAFTAAVNGRIWSHLNFCVPTLFCYALRYARYLRNAPLRSAA
eukprot:4308618-Prymnesium_polylepis.1